MALIEGTGAQDRLLCCQNGLELLAWSLDSASVGDRVPVLGDGQSTAGVAVYRPTPSLRELEKLGDIGAAALMVASRINQRNHDSDRLTVVVDGDEMLSVGVTHAALNHRKIVSVRSAETLKEALAVDRVRSVALVASLDWLSGIGFDALNEVFERAGGGSPPSWGILTAQSAEALSRLVARTALRAPSARAEMALLHWGREARHVSPTTPGFSTYDLSSAEKREIDEILRRPSPLALVAGHGRDYCALEGNLCTRPASEGPDSRACVMGLECANPAWPRRSATSLPYEFVVLDVCDAAKLQGSFAPNMNIALRILEGRALGVLAPFRGLPSFPVGAPLVWKLARTGCTLGEIARELNIAVTRVQGIASPYVLFGDPDHVVFEGAAARDEIEISRLDAQRVRVKIHGARDSRLADVLFGPSIEGGAPRPYYLCRAPRSWEHESSRVLLFPDGRRSVLAIDTPGMRGESGPLQLDFTTAPPFDLGLVAEAVRLLEYVDLEKSLGGEGSVRDLRARLEGHGGVLHASADKVIPLSRPYQFMVALRDGLARVQETVRREALLRWAARLVEAKGELARCMEIVTGMYITYGAQRRIPGECPLCSNLLLIEYDYHFSHRESSRRVRRACERCRDLSDSPPGTPLLSMKMPRALRPGATFTAEIIGDNDGDSPLEIEACAVFAHRDVHGSVAPAEPTVRVRVPARSRFVVPLTCRVDETILRHAFALRALLFIRGDLHWCSAPFLVQDAPSTGESAAR